MWDFRQWWANTAGGPGNPPVRLTTPAQRYAWYNPLVAQNNGANYPPGMTPDLAFRYHCKPWPNKDQSGATNPSAAMHDELALATPIFARGCSQFIVEFAGDYLDQKNPQQPKVGEY